VTTEKSISQKGLGTRRCTKNPVPARVATRFEAFRKGRSEPTTVSEKKSVIGWTQMGVYFETFEGQKTNSGSCMACRRNRGAMAAVLAVKEDIRRKRSTRLRCNQGART